MYLTFTGLTNLAGTITNNSDAQNKALMGELINIKLGETMSQRDWYFLYASNTTRSTVASQQFYDVPGDMGKLISAPVRFNTTLYNPKQAPTRQFWDELNVSNSPTADTPVWFYQYGDKVGYYPTPTSANGSITYNYKKKAVELSITDFTGTVESATSGANAVIMGVSELTSAMTGLYIKIDKGTTATSGDGRWYEIGAVNTGSQVTLVRDYEGNSFTSAPVLNYTIGQISPLPENFQHLPVYGAAELYYTSIVPEQAQAQMYKGLYTQGLLQMQREYGQVSTDPKIEDTDGEMVNPNFYITY